LRLHTNNSFFFLLPSDRLQIKKKLVWMVGIIDTICLGEEVKRGTVKETKG
jgi:hypothetical protein